MVRLLRLTASVVMVVSGTWLAVTFVWGPGGGGERVRPAPRSTEPSAAVGSRSSRLIPDSAVPLPNVSETTQREAAAAKALAPLADVLTTTVEAEPPAPLPKLPAEITERAPALEPAYRSALDLPPPPLLDAHSPPPLVGGSTWRQPQPDMSLASLRPGRPQLDTGEARPADRGRLVNVPQVSSYVVRDGDDLTTIASRFYGHPSAARLVFEANRDRLPAADMLPIGVTLMLPPPPEPYGGRHRPGGWIEPVR